MTESSSDRCASIRINGMTCASCELLLERKLKTVPGVKDVDINHRTGIARITADANHLPSQEKIASVVRKAGYSLDDGEAPTVSSIDPNKRKWMEIGGSLIIIFALYKLLQAFDIVSLAPSTSGALSFGGILVIGLVAGTSSCLAVAGGLLIAIAAKYNEVHQAETPWEKFKPLLQFNIGRLVSYFVLGGIVGLLGQSVTLSTKMTGYMSIGIAFIMLYLALTILQIVPKGSFPIRPPKKLSRWIASLSDSNHPAAPFALGALTFFLPCGFTQSLQLVALASGSFMTGALTMFIFALGTLPSLLGISAISSTAKGNASRLFLRFAGTFVFVLAIGNINSGFALAGINLASAIDNTQQAPATAPVINGNVQEVSMKVTTAGYVPSNLTIKAGVPVKWMIDGAGAYGCTSQIVIPDLNITKSLSRGINEVDFTAPNPGQLAFSCSMGMVRGSFTVL